MIRNRIVLLMHAEMALTVAITKVQRAGAGEDVLDRLLAIKRDVMAVRTRIEADAARQVPA